MIITFTKFNGATATSKIEIRATLEQIRDGVLSVSAPSKAELPWIKLATFGDNATAKGSLRHDANVNIVFGVEGDYDSLDMSPQTAVALLDLAGIHALVYTSPSYTPDGPKWRVLCPLAKPCLPADRKAFVAKLNCALGGVLARESFVLSQSFFYGRVADNPHHEAWIVDGQCIDEVGGLEEVYPQRIAYRAVHVPTGGATSTDTGKDALRAACESFARPDADGQRHQYILAATAFVAPYIKAGMLDETEATEAIREACVQSGREPHPDETEDALHRAVAYVDPWKEDPIHEWAPAVEPACAAAEPEVVFREITENESARLFARRYTDSFKFDVNAGGNGRGDTGAWMGFRDGVGWERDATSRVEDSARIFIELGRQQWGHKQSEKAGSIAFAKATVRGCQSDPFMVVTRDVWDTDPFILGIPGGHINLRTGEQFTARRDVLVRHRTAVLPALPGTVSPLWSRFLAEATGGDTEMQAWLQRLAGYCLTGDTSEEIFAFIHGPGNNGKGVFLDALMGSTGSYAMDIAIDFFMADSNLNKPQYIAELDGVRLATADETEQGKPFAEATIKQLTGNTSQISARRLYGSPFTFKPRCKIIIIGNHAPTLKGRGQAMERRMRVVPFVHAPARLDLDLKEKMRAEYPFVLRWMLDGCLMWQRDRLGMCAAVERASRLYFEDQDSVTQWAGDRCTVAQGTADKAGTLLEDFNTWLRGRGDKAVNSKAFKEAVEARLGCRHVRRMDGAWYEGIAVRSEFSDFKL